MSPAGERRGVTVADVVRALIDSALDGIDAKLWLAQLLPGLDVEAHIRAEAAARADEAAPATEAVRDATPAGAPPAEPGHAPFASAEDAAAAQAMMCAGATGREIAAEFDLPVGPVAEWVGRERGR